MTPLIFASVLGAAVLHASWNALVKHGGDPFLRLALVNLTGSALSLPFLPFVDPPVAAAWPWTRSRNESGCITTGGEIACWAS